MSAPTNRTHGLRIDLSGAMSFVDWPVRYPGWDEVHVPVFSPVDPFADEVPASPSLGRRVYRRRVIHGPLPELSVYFEVQP